MEVLKSTKIGVVGFSQREEVGLDETLEGVTSIVGVLRCMGEIPMFRFCWRPFVGS